MFKKKEKIIKEEIIEVEIPKTVYVLVHVDSFGNEKIAENIFWTNEKEAYEFCGRMGLRYKVNEMIFSFDGKIKQKKEVSNEHK